MLHPSVRRMASSGALRGEKGGERTSWRSRSGSSASSSEGDVLGRLLWNEDQSSREARGRNVTDLTPECMRSFRLISACDGTWRLTLLGTDSETIPFSLRRNKERTGHSFTSSTVAFTFRISSSSATISSILFTPSHLINFTSRRDEYQSEINAGSSFYRNDSRLYLSLARTFTSTRTFPPSIRRPQYFRRLSVKRCDRLSTTFHFFLPFVCVISFRSIETDSTSNYRLHGTG